MKKNEFEPLINTYDDYLTLFQDAKNNNDYEEYLKYATEQINIDIEEENKTSDDKMKLKTIDEIRDSFKILNPLPKDTNLCGEELPVPGLISLTNRVPASVPSVTHSSVPLMPSVALNTEIVIFCVLLRCEVQESTC